MKRLSVLAVAALVVFTLHAQTLERTIPLGVGSEVDFPWLLAFDSTSSSVYVADEEGYGLLSIDAVTHKRLAYIPIDGSYAYSLFSVPGRDRVYYIDEILVAAIDTRANSMVAQIPDDEIGFLGGGCNPLTGKVYCCTEEDTVLILEGTSGRVLERLRIGYMDDYDWSQPFAANTMDNKVYLCTYDDDWREGLVVLHGETDTVMARIDLGDAYLDAMCYDDVNNLVWCCVEDTCTLLLALDGAIDSVVARISLGERYVLSMCFNRADNKVYCAGDEGYVASVDAAGRRLLDWLYIGGESEVISLCVNEREHKLYCVSDESFVVVVFDTRDDSWIADVVTSEESWLAAMAYSPVSNEVFCSDYENSKVVTIDGVTDSVTGVIRTLAGIEEVCFARDNRQLYVSGMDYGVIDVVDCCLDTLAAEISVGFGASDFCWNPYERRLFVASSDRDSVAVVDTDTREVVSRLAVEDPDYLFLDSADNEVYCCGSSSWSLAVLAGDGSCVLDTIPLDLKPDAACYDPLRNRLYLAEDGNKGLLVVDCCVESVLARLPTEEKSHDFLVAVPEEARVYCANSKSVSVYDCRLNALRCVLDFDAKPTSMCYDPIGRRVFCALGRSGIVVIDPVGDTVVTRLTAPDRTRKIGYNQAGNSVLWVGDTLVGFIDARTLEQTGMLHIPDLSKTVVCDEEENRLYLFGLSSMYIVRDTELEFHAQSQAGPALVGRTVALYGTRSAALLDAVGRKVMVLRPGENRLVGISPGTYFILREGEYKAQKVVLPQ